jgi:hypothetical protein
MPVEETGEARELIASTGVLLKTLRDNISEGNVVHAAEVFIDSLNQRGHWTRLTSPVQQMILANIYTALGDTRRPLTTWEGVGRRDRMRAKLRTLRRRSHKDRTTWERIAKIASDFLPSPRILHPWPQRRCRRTPKVGAACGKSARAAVGGGW